MQPAALGAHIVRLSRLHGLRVFTCRSCGDGLSILARRPSGAIRGVLRRGAPYLRARWLLVFDNADGARANLGARGVGKTQIVFEYACRFMADYDRRAWQSAQQKGAHGGVLAEIGFSARLLVDDAYQIGSYEWSNGSRRFHF